MDLTPSETFSTPRWVTDLAPIETSDGRRLHAHRWAPSGPVRLEVILLHGYGEHAGRYARAAEVWNELGIAVTAVDLRGHGRSEGRRGYVERFSDYHRDAEALYARVRGRDASPVAVFGHSMGGLLAAHWLIARGTEGIRGLALSSPYLGLAFPVPAYKLAMGRVLSRVAPQFALPSGLTGADVAKDPDLARSYDHDPLNLKKATARWFTEAEAAMDDVFRGAHRLRLPTLLMYAGEDRVASPAAVERLATCLPGEPEIERVEGGHHEILNEPEPLRSQIARRYGVWLAGLVS